MPVASWLADHPVRGALELLVGEHLDDVADVDDDGSLVGLGGEPLAVLEDLEAADIVLERAR
jgi:hypothetical protein